MPEFGCSESYSTERVHVGLESRNKSNSENQLMRINVHAIVEGRKMTTVILKGAANVRSFESGFQQG